RGLTARRQGPQGVVCRGHGHPSEKVAGSGVHTFCWTSVMATFEGVPHQSKTWAVAVPQSPTPWVIWTVRVKVPSAWTFTTSVSLRSDAGAELAKLMTSPATA